MSNLQVELYSAEKYLMGGVANNITLSGMYIACDPNLVKTDSVVEIKYHLNTNGIPHKCSLYALVKEVLTDGVMVDFHRFDNNTFCCIRDIVLQPSADHENNSGVSISSSTAIHNETISWVPKKYCNAGY